MILFFDLYILSVGLWQSEPYQ